MLKRGTFYSEKQALPDVPPGKHQLVEYLKNGSGFVHRSSNWLLRTCGKCVVSLPISYLHFVSFNFLFTRPISVIGRPSALKQEGETDHDQLVLQPCCLRARACVCPVICNIFLWSGRSFVSASSSFWDPPSDVETWFRHQDANTSHSFNLDKNLIIILHICFCLHQRFSYINILVN